MLRILYCFLASLARLAVRSGRSKDLELIVLRHQLAMLGRRDASSAITDDDRSLLGAIARRRIETDEIESQALDWRLDHISKFGSARPWLLHAADLVLDTTNVTPESAAEAIIEAAAKTRPTVI